MAKIEKNKFYEIQCPICKERFTAKKPRTLKQWRASLRAHLIVKLNPRTGELKHKLKKEEIESVIDEYFKSLKG